METVNAKREKIVCPFCRADQPQPWAVDRGYHAVQCGACRFIYVSPRPAQSMIATAVETGIHTDLGGYNVITRRVDAKVEAFRKSLAWTHADIWQRGKPLSWMDMGSGFGEFLEAVKALAPKGSRVVGAEPMKPKADAANALGHETYNCYPPDVPETFDFLSLIQVFSHIPDFGAFLQLVKPRLNSGGEIYLVTGNAADLRGAREVPGELDLPDHLVFASRAHLQGFLERAGFEIISIQEERVDTWYGLARDCAKLLLGRSVRPIFPGTTAFRDLHLRARLKH